jgi:hypothetical protein
VECSAYSDLSLKTFTRRSALPCAPRATSWATTARVGHREFENIDVNQCGRDALRVTYGLGTTSSSYSHHPLQGRSGSGHPVFLGWHYRRTGLTAPTPIHYRL